MTDDFFVKAFALLDRAETYVRSACKNAVPEACDLHDEISAFLQQHRPVPQRQLITTLTCTCGKTADVFATEGAIRTADMPEGWEFSDLHWRCPEHIRVRA